MQNTIFFRKALGSWGPVLNLSLLCARYIILKEVYLHFRCIRHPDSFFGSWRSAKFTNSRLFALVSPRLRRSSRGSCLRFGVFSTVLDSASALSARLANSDVLPRVGSSFSEDVPPVVQFFRNSRRLGEVSACGASGVVSSLESYWTLSVSGLLQAGNESTSFSQLAPCFYHEWINLRFLARVDEDAVLSDSAHSGGAAADAVVPVALHRPWVCLDSEAVVR